MPRRKPNKCTLRTPLFFLTRATVDRRTRRTCATCTSRSVQRTIASFPCASPPARTCCQHVMRTPSQRAAPFSIRDPATSVLARLPAFDLVPWAWWRSPHYLLWQPRYLREAWWTTLLGQGVRGVRGDWWGCVVWKQNEVCSERSSAPPARPSSLPAPMQQRTQYNNKAHLALPIPQTPPPSSQAGQDCKLRRGHSTAQHSTAQHSTAQHRTRPPTPATILLCWHA